MSHDDIRAALAKAAPGPWAYHADQHRDDGHVWRLGGDGDDICRLAYPDRESDAHLIANAPTWLAELLAEVDALTARAEAAEQLLTQVRKLHSEREAGPLEGYCRSCGYAGPCPTLRVLDGGA